MNKTLLAASILTAVSTSAFAANNIPSTLSNLMSNGNSIVAGSDTAAVVGANISANESRIVVFGENVQANGDGVVAVGHDVTAGNTFATAIGYDAKAMGNSSLALGVHTKAAFKDSIAIGSGAHIDGTAGVGGIAIGRNSNAVESATSLGTDSSAEGWGATSVGTIAKATSVGATAIGNNAQAKDSAYATAIGTSAQATGAYSNALGALSNASAWGASAVGIYSNATAKNGIALGSYSVANRAEGASGYDPVSKAASTDASPTWKSTMGAVSLGDQANGKTRQLTNLAAGSEDTDAVNMAQLKSLQSTINNQGGSLVNINNRLSDMTHEYKKGIAGTTAIASLHYLDYDSDNKWSFAAGYGHYKGENAAAIGAAYRPNEDVLLNLSTAIGANHLVGAGISFRTGHTNQVKDDRKSLAKEVEALRALVMKQQEQIIQLMKK